MHMDDSRPLSWPYTLALCLGFCQPPMHSLCGFLLPIPVSHTYHLVSPRFPRRNVLQEPPGPRAVMPPLVLPCPDLPAVQNAGTACVM